MEEKILEFIHRRFPMDCGWMNGNCFYFAKILQARFYGEIVYDPIDGHFLFLATDGNLYDWTGRREYTQEQRRKMFLWRDSASLDAKLHERIVRDCIK